jgi:NADH:ubiquinone oxidoreductase subunit
MAWLERIFVWWQGATLATSINTRRFGTLVGSDPSGNRYYQDRAGRRRWVIYNGTVEASRVPPEWHGWLHHTFREPPTVEPLAVKPWEKEHRPNMTGTPEAYHPPGSLAESGIHAPATGEYEPWQPD